MYIEYCIYQYLLLVYTVHYGNCIVLGRNRRATNLLGVCIRLDFRPTPDVVLTQERVASNTKFFFEHPQGIGSSSRF